MLSSSKLSLDHKMLKTMMIDENHTMHNIDIIPLNRTRNNYTYQLKIMCGVAALIDVKLSHKKIKNMTLLH